MNTRKLISFDWALKRLLRSKANHEVLEGFLSELLKDEITILEILESESNRDQAHDTSNRVDLKVRNQRQEIILIEVQYEREFDFLQRILFATAKTITEHMAQGEPYDQVVKVISINILYFDLGYGADYIYHGRTHFVGLHHRDELQLNDRQRKFFGKRYPHELYPEYYLLKVRQFDDVARDSLDEWIYFLKHQEIKGEFRAKGLQKAKEVLDIMHLGEQERRAYEWHMEELSYQASMYQSSYYDGRLDGEEKGRAEGRIEGREEGREEGKAEGREEGSKEKAMVMAKVMKQKGINLTDIAEISGLSVEEIEQLSSLR